MKYKVTADSFLKDVKGHQLEIIKDDGLYRHLRCAEKGTICQSFNIVTAPGQLFYYGDMGSFSFSRLKDMFNFFRDDELKINAGYWSEKLQATDKYGGYRTFEWDEFEKTLRDYVEDEDDEARNDEIQAFITKELQYIEQDEFGAVDFVRNFNESNDVNVTLVDFWECTYHVPSTRYLWCCYAIVWAIQQYDKAKALEVAS